jgi:hypothetical protein
MELTIMHYNALLPRFLPYIGALFRLGAERDHSVPPKKRGQQALSNLITSRRKF